jgi:hypothetical protein
MPKEDEWDDDELREALGEDYYAGYYWGNEPYRSSELPGRKSDIELEKDILNRLHSLGFNEVQIQVINALAILTGTVNNLKRRRKAGAETWKIDGVYKIMNNLRVRRADTSGPSWISA